jgi:multiple sugar transport system substrate-binding protein
MTNNHSRGLNGISRRRALQSAAGAVAAGSVLGLPSIARAQRTRIVRWWSPQAAPAQLAAYKYQIETFEAAHPTIQVVFEATSDEGYPAQLAAGFASGQVPGIVTHVPSFAVTNYFNQNLLTPFDGIIKAIGQEKFYPGANRVYEVKPGVHAGIGIGNSAANMMWLRKDLMQAAGIDKAPRTWDELRAAARKMQQGGVFGAPLPYARNSMTSLIFICFIHNAGGAVFSPDLKPTLTTDAVVNALEFYTAMRELCPPGATGYSWGESLTAFVSGATATGIYAGRVLANVTAQNPKIAEHVTCAPYPTISTSVAPWTFNDFPSVMIPRQFQDQEAAAMFAAWLYKEDGYVRQLHAAPGHVLPVLKTIAESAAYQNNDIIKRFKPEVSLMAESAAAGHNLGWESTAHQTNIKAREVIGSHVMADLVQRVVLNKENPRQAAAWAQDRVAEIMART